MNHTGPLQFDLDQAQRWSLIIGVAALALCGGGAFFDPTQFLRAYLVGYMFWLDLALGCVALVMLHHLTGGNWGYVVRRVFESGAGTIPLLAVLILPVFIGMRRLYSWAHGPAGFAETFSGFKAQYLNIETFIIRAVFYFVTWLLLAYFLRKWSFGQDASGDPSLLERLQLLSGPGLVIYGFTVTFASVDWVMSLEPKWSSTIYGMMFMVAQGLAGLAFAVIVAMLLADRKPLAEVITPSHFHDLGNLLFTFVMLWGYLSFSQFLLIWCGNLQDEIPWYTSRGTGAWAVVAAILIVFHFAVPFVLLLSRYVKRRRKLLAAVAAGLLLMGFVDLYWVTMPAFEPAAPHVNWMDLLAPIGVGGIWIAWFIRGLKSQALLPLRDPRFQEALSHEH